MGVYSTVTEIKIPFFDVDPMGITWHGNYIKYMEVARCDLFSQLNYDYIAMKKDGFAYPVAKMETKFIEPTTFNQEIIITTTLESIEPALIIKYIFRDKKTNKKIFKASTMQIAVDTVTLKSKYEAPLKLKEILER